MGAAGMMGLARAKDGDDGDGKLRAVGAVKARSVGERGLIPGRVEGSPSPMPESPCIVEVGDPRTSLEGRVLRQSVPERARVRTFARLRSGTATPVGLAGASSPHGFLGERLTRRSSTSELYPRSSSNENCVKDSKVDAAFCWGVDLALEAKGNDVDVSAESNTSGVVGAEHSASESCGVLASE